MYTDVKKCTIIAEFTVIVNASICFVAIREDRQLHIQYNNLILLLAVLGSCQDQWLSHISPSKCRGRSADANFSCNSWKGKLMIVGGFCYFNKQQ